MKKIWKVFEKDTPEGKMEYMVQKMSEAFPDYVWYREGRKIIRESLPPKEEIFPRRFPGPYRLYPE